MSGVRLIDPLMLRRPDLHLRGRRERHVERSVRGVTLRTVEVDRLTSPVVVDGKQFRVGAHRHALRGVTYGTFKPRSDGERFPELAVATSDFAAMQAAGFNTVRTYTAPPDDLIDAAAAHGIRTFAGVHTDDWRYLVGLSRRQQRSHIEAGAKHVRDVARRLRDRPDVVALCVGNEVPADVVRWFGADRVAASLERFAEVVKEEDPTRLVTYGNYPSSEYLSLDALDFVTFNIFLDDTDGLRHYLTRLHHVAGDRPVVLGEFGRHVDDSPGAEHEQARLLDAQYETAIERGLAGMFAFSWTDEWHVGDAAVEDWRFGLTRSDRSPREALHVAQRWNARTVADLTVEWPRISVVVCARNEQATIRECLEATVALRYPDFEVIVVDDGSTDSTAEIARTFRDVQTISIPHSGLGHARNVGLDASTGEIVAYLDADAYPSPEWLHYLFLAFDRRTVGGSGGPNLSPPTDPAPCQRVAVAPGGPAHVLLSDDRAEHIPGCNMAFWRSVLIDIGGFDPVYRAAGDDVDVCWKVLDRGWDIGFHPAALVWHHRRGSIRAYLRQQRGYGRAEALVAARHPDRFTRLRSARWRGRIYSPERRNHPGQRIYRGPLGTAAYQSIYRRGSFAVDWAHQLAVPIFLAIALGALPASPVWTPARWLVIGCLAMVASVFAYDVANAGEPHGTTSTLRSRVAIAVLHLVQPLARWWGRARHWQVAHRELGADPLPETLRSADGGVLLMAADRPREALTRALVSALRAAGYGVGATTGWEDHDGAISGSLLVDGELVTSEHPPGTVQVRVHIRPRRLPIAVAVVLAAAAFAAFSMVGLAVVAWAMAVDVMVGAWRLGPRLRAALTSHRKRGVSAIDESDIATVQMARTN